MEVQSHVFRGQRIVVCRAEISNYRLHHKIEISVDDKEPQNGSMPQSCQYN